MKKHITNIRKAVCTIANDLRKSGYTLSQAFRKAWRKVKARMTFRAAGVTYNMRQEKLAYLAGFQPKDIMIRLIRQQDNPYDKNAIGIVADLLPTEESTLIGYVPKEIAGEFAKAMDKGVTVTAAFLGIIGGYSYKETYGALLNVTI